MKPAEAPALRGDAVLDGSESLIRRINRTNASVRLPDGGTLTDALARRGAARRSGSSVRS